jgi:3-methyl-2-oxobutanoate hydroxymethyltransferase
VIQEWSDRYGDKVAGWWFDGGYDHIKFNEAIAQTYAKAVKHGNPNAIVTFNPGVRLIRHTQAVRRGAPGTFVVGDMPYMSYQVSDEMAIANAGRFIQEAGADGVKLEGGGPRILSRIRAINEAGILVMGHIGLTPQFMGQIGGYKAQGRSAQAAMTLIKQAQLIEEAGACSILVEGVPTAVGKAIAERAGIPILGIGAGSGTHGQLLIYADMVGMYDNFTPKFVKKYANVGEVLTGAFAAYVKEVREGQFPVDAEHTYKMPEEEIAALAKLLK